MDKFTFIIGIIGLLLLIISLIIIISAVINTIKGRKKIKNFLSSLILFLILFAFATSFIYLSLFLQTFSRFTHEEKIGLVYAYGADKKMRLLYINEKRNSAYTFELLGDQWMVEGYLLRWSPFLRFLGAGSYYRVTRFSGRWKKPYGKAKSVYQIYPEEKLWKFLLKHGERIPFIDTAYGIGAFQYPRPDTFYLYINDTGFILRTR
jgi:hypothetical protein